MNDTVKKQILYIRDTGLTNMFDVRIVLQLALAFEFHELVVYLKENKKAYAQFILTGMELYTQEGRK